MSLTSIFNNVYYITTDKNLIANYDLKFHSIVCDSIFLVYNVAKKLPSDSNKIFLLSIEKIFSPSIEIFISYCSNISIYYV